MYKKLTLPLVTLLFAMLAGNAFAHEDCKSPLSDNMHKMKDTMRPLARAVRGEKTAQVKQHADKMIELLEKAKELRPSDSEITKKNGHSLDKAVKTYNQWVNEMIALFQKLKTLDKTQGIETLEEIKQLQKQSHQTFKNC